MPEAPDPATVKAMQRSFRLALAVAENRPDEVEKVYAEAAGEPGGVVLLVNTMAGTLASLAQGLAGSNWRAAFKETIDSLDGS